MRRAIAFVIILIGTSAIVANALFYTGEMPLSSLFGDWSDKIFHVAAFAVLAIIAELPGPAPRSLAVLVGLAAVIEIGQLAVPERLAEFWDFAASLIGVALGWGAAVVCRRAVRRAAP